MKRKELLLLVILFTFTMMAMFSTKAEAAGAVKLNNKKLVLEMGTERQLNVLNTTDKVKWSTSDKKIVKVKNGLLKPVGVPA